MRFMRICGYVTLVIGILMFILCVVLEFVGPHLGFMPFLYSICIIAIGWRLRSWGKGLLQPKPAATAEYPGAAPSATPDHLAAPEGEFSTVEMPLTPEVAAVITRASARARRILLYIVGGCLVFGVVLGGVLAATDKTPGEGHTFMVIFAVALPAAPAAVIYALYWLMQRSLRRDLRGMTYLRTTGPVKVVWMGRGTMLRLADRAFPIAAKVGQALTTLNWVRVDYTLHQHLILGAWDRDGRSVYCLPGYSVGSGTSGA
jgi:hypothetical protein